MKEFSFFLSLIYNSEYHHQIHIVPLPKKTPPFTVYPDPEAQPATCHSVCFRVRGNKLIASNT